MLTTCMFIFSFIVKFMFFFSSSLNKIKVITCKKINVGVYVDMFDYILHVG